MAFPGGGGFDPVFGPLSAFERAMDQTMRRMMAPPPSGRGGPGAGGAAGGGGMGIGGMGGPTLGLPAPGGGAGGGGTMGMGAELGPWLSGMMMGGGGQGGGGGAITSGLGASALSPYVPPADVHELSDRFEIRLEAPGVKEDEVDISVSDGVLTVACHPHPVAKEERDSHGRVVRRERFSSAWTRSWALPEDAEQEGGEGARAWMYRGLLCVQVMKKPPAEEKEAAGRPVKRIAISGATTAPHPHPRSPGAGGKAHAVKGGEGKPEEAKKAAEMAVDGAGAGAGKKK